jgi:hypothetical protein
MKVKFKYGIRTYSGTLDELTFGSYFKDRVCIARRYVVPRLTDQNNLIVGKMKNLAVIYGDVSESYKAELKQYAAMHSIFNTQGKTSGYGLCVVGKNDVPICQ